MNKKIIYILAALGLVILMTAKKWLDLAASTIAFFEQFSASPYWDVSRWSWGYGTAAPGPTGTISREQALNDLKAHVTADYDYLAPKIRRALRPNQWAAYLSFSYNEGAGNADNLVDDINSGDDAALEIHWKKYVYADGVVNSDLVVRRAKEWKLWSQNIL